MYPMLRIGDLCISTYRVMCVIAALVVPAVIMLRRRRYAMNWWQTLLLCVSAIAAGFFGCNTLYWLENMQRLFDSGWRFSGFSFFGCLLFAPWIMILLALIFRIPVKKAMDLLAVGLPPFLGIVRIGCFCGGCCGGKQVLHADGSITSFPTQLLECALDFAIFSVLLSLEKKHRLDGYRLPLFFVLYGTVRFLIEFLRATEKNVLGMSLGQIYSILIFLVGGTVLLCARKSLRAPVSD